MKHTVSIASFDNEASAERLYTRLKEKGIEAEVTDPGENERLLVIVKPIIKYKVRVVQEQAGEARKILAQEADGLPGLFLCPQCRSSRVEYPQLTRKFVGLLGIFGLLSRIGLIEPEFYCQDCHSTWAPGQDPNVERERVRAARASG